MRFNDARRTMVAQLPPLSYAQVRAVLEARVKAMGSDGETPLDQRLADALVSLLTQSGAAGIGPGPWWWPTCPSRSGRPRLDAARRARARRADQRGRGPAPAL